MTELEIIDNWNQFESRCAQARDTQVSHIREDRAFLSGDQWEAEDKAQLATDRYPRTVDVTSVSINAIRNQYMKAPFQWYTGDSEVDQLSDSFLATRDNAKAAVDVLESVVAYGLGIFALSTEEVEGEIVPCIYAPEDITKVYLDPDSTAGDGSDAYEGAIVELKSRTWVKHNYPDIDVEADPLVTCHGMGESLPLVTYYVREGGVCNVYRLLGDREISEPSVIELDRIPLFPVYGERIWVNDKIVYRGIVRKAAPVQKLINMAYTQLGERLAICPNPVIMTNVDAVEGLDSAYRNYGKTRNPLLLHNRLADDGKTVLEKPEYIQNTVQYGDITGIISANLEFMHSITGVDSKGMADGNLEITATQAMLDKQTESTNIRHFYEAMRVTYKAVAEAVLGMLGVQGVSVDIIEGPESQMERQIAMQMLTSLLPTVQQDPIKLQAVLDGMLLANADNAILRQVYGVLHSRPQPTQMEQQAMEIVDQMKQAIDKKNQEIMQLQEQIKSYESGERNTAQSIQGELLKMKLQHQQKLQEMAFQKELDGNADAAKAAMDLEKQQMDIEKQAVQLDAVKTKAQAEKAKAAASIVQSMTPTVEANAEVKDETSIPTQIS